MEIDLVIWYKLLFLQYQYDFVSLVAYFSALFVVDYLFLISDSQVVIVKYVSPVHYFFFEYFLRIIMSANPQCVVNITADSLFSGAFKI